MKILLSLATTNLNPRLLLNGDKKEVFYLKLWNQIETIDIVSDYGLL